MPQIKYFIYSKEKLEYVEVYKNKWQKYIKNYPLFLFGCFAGIFSILLIFALFHTPTEKKLINEKKILEHDLQHLSKKIDETENKINFLNTRDDSLYRVILGIEPFPQSVKQAGQGGSDKSTLTIDGSENKVVKKLSKKITNINSKANVLEHSYKEILLEAEKNKIKMLHIPAIMPINNKDLQRTGSGFGMRKHPILNITRMHEGIDFYATKGTEVYATADGIIKSARFSATFGKVVVIDHGYNLETYYAHLSKFNVEQGQKVKRGHVIGYVGNTGLSSGAHLHYEVHLNKKEVDPVNYFFGDLTAKEYDEIIKISQREIYSMD